MQWSWIFIGTWHKISVCRSRKSADCRQLIGIRMHLTRALNPLRSTSSCPKTRIHALSRSLADSTSRRSLLQLMGVGVAGTAVTAAGLNEALAKNNKGNVNTTSKTS